MDKDILKQIILASIPLIGAVISIYILPILKNFVIKKIDKEDIERTKIMFSSIIEFIDKMVKAMEQEHPEWKGENKKNEVLNLTIEYIKTFFGIELEYDDVKFISEVIEGVVKEVKYPSDVNKMTFLIDKGNGNSLEDDLK